MTLPEPNYDRTCPQCGAALAAETNHCWLCSTALEGIAADATGPPAVFEPRAAHQFGLSTLMLIVTLLAVLCGVLSISPGLGVVLAIVATPALVRTGMTAAKRKVRGRPMTVPEKLEAFAGSVGVVVIIGIAAGVGFFATCWAGFFGGAMAAEGGGVGGYEPIAWGLVTGVGLGILAGLFVAYLLIRRLWPRKD